ncbi:DedA family protein [Gottfriedia luciferensis]|uniref:DedA family protein n=1 Tax=Gottfriedia luciferensis TaxID=178774 RepID=UPI000B4430BB|nr:DedA family protein [Gottfriedia luciferensis]
MNIETISHYIDLYGYIIIFIFLFCGIVGIPAPEESLLFLMGMLIWHNQLTFGMTLIASISGAFIGMITAYVCGKFLANSLIKNYGKYIGITSERLGKVKDKYSGNVHKTIILGFFMPGIRQLSPYVAGITNVPFLTFTIFSLIGTLLWTIPFIMGGYYLGKKFNIDPKYVPYLGIALLVVFLIVATFKSIRKKRKKH